MFGDGVKVSDMQTGLQISNGNITGTLKYLSEGALVNAHGAGNFMALKFTSTDPRVTQIQCRMNPGVSGWVTLDSDMNGGWKVTNKDNQVFETKVSADGFEDVITSYNLSGLTLESENVG